MLVLSRKHKQAVMVGGSNGFQRLLKVTVLDIRGGIVKLGFEVDPDVPVHRLEVWERIRTGVGPPLPHTADPAAPGACGSP
ncbi:MAG TPA: carbon storage regulator [Gemmataceae bacterium]|nr:carbon storage regulator [Gemmataceae bacterium]